MRLMFNARKEEDQCASNSAAIHFEDYIKVEATLISTRTLYKNQSLKEWASHCIKSQDRECDSGRLYLRSTGG